MQRKNNIIFDKKHHYVNILNEAEKLKVVLEKERELSGDEGIENQLRTVYKMRNIAFAGLVKEGMQCFTIKDVEYDDPSASMVGMIINGKQYDCRSSVLNKTLKEEYGENGIQIKSGNGNYNPGKARESSDDGEYVSQNNKQNATSYQDNSRSKIAQEVHTTSIKDTSQGNENKNLKTTETLSETKKEIKGKDREETFTKTVNQPTIMKNNEIEEIDMTFEKPKAESSNKKEVVEKKFVRPDEPETEKHIDSMVFDMIDVGVVQKNNSQGEYVNFTVVPLEISKKDKAMSDIFVCMETNDSQQVYASDINGRKTVTTKIGQYEFIVKGAWKDQKFISTIYPANQMNSEEFVKHEERKEFMPADAKVIGFGHNVSLINEKSGGVTKIHTAPLDIENNEMGIVNVMVCVENSVGERVLKVSKNGIVLYETEEYTAQIMGFWKDKVFVSNVKVTNK